MCGYEIPGNRPAKSLFLVAILCLCVSRGAGAECSQFENLTDNLWEGKLTAMPDPAGCNGAVAKRVMLPEGKKLGERIERELGAKNDLAQFGQVLVAFLPSVQSTLGESPECDEFARELQKAAPKYFENSPESNCSSLRRMAEQMRDKIATILQQRETDRLAALACSVLDHLADRVWSEGLRELPNLQGCGDEQIAVKLREQASQLGQRIRARLHERDKRAEFAEDLPAFLGTVSAVLRGPARDKHCSAFMSGLRAELPSEFASSIENRCDDLPGIGEAVRRQMLVSNKTGNRAGNSSGWLPWLVTLLLGALSGAAGAYALLRRGGHLSLISRHADDLTLVRNDLQDMETLQEAERLKAHELEQRLTVVEEEVKRSNAGNPPELAAVMSQLGNQETALKDHGGRLEDSERDLKTMQEKLDDGITSLSTKIDLLQIELGRWSIALQRLIVAVFHSGEEPVLAKAPTPDSDKATATAAWNALKSRRGSLANILSSFEKNELDSRLLQDLNKLPVLLSGQEDLEALRQAALRVQDRLQDTAWKIDKLSLLQRLLDGRTNIEKYEARELALRQGLQLAISLQDSDEYAKLERFNVRDWIREEFVRFADLLLNRYREAGVEQRELQPAYERTLEVLRYGDREPIEITLGRDRFDPKEHIARSDSFDSSRSSGVILAVARTGFRDTKTGLVVQKPEVVVNRV